MSVGKHGSPGKVLADETLHSILIAPTDFDNDQIMASMLTHLERKGMSVMRDFSSDREINSIINSRIDRDPKERSFFGVASIKFEAIKALKSLADSEFRIKDERLYSVLDTDMKGLPNHADVFFTLPSKANQNNKKQAFRKERAQLVELLSKGIVAASDFRAGKFLESK